jgi:hypothetical protein
MSKLQLFTLLILLYSCGQLPVQSDKSDDTVSLQTAIDQARSSYLRGCVDAYYRLKIPRPFGQCLDMAKAHERELWEIMNQVTEIE